MKPVACGNQVYSTGTFSSSATISAILFSKPSPLSLENGMLAGSAQTRSAVRLTRSARCPSAVLTNAAKPAPKSTISSATRRLFPAETGLLMLFRRSRLFDPLGRASARQYAVCARHQVDVYVVNVAHDVGVVAECRHLALLVSPDYFAAASDNSHEVGIGRVLHRADESGRVARSLSIWTVTHVAFRMVAAEP